MCARYSLATPPGALEALVSLPLDDLPPRYNIAPTQLVAAVVAPAPGERSLRFFRWGLIPSWAKDETIAHRLVNARSETVREKPAFRGAYKYRRCLLPASSFFEWSEMVPVTEEVDLFGERTTKKGKPRRQPYLIGMRSGEPFAIAGLWETWIAPTGEEVDTCTLLTTEANGVVSLYHDRMPVILDRDQFDTWLDPRRDGSNLVSLLAPYPEDPMHVYPVDPVVNNPRFEGPECLRRIA